MVLGYGHIWVDAAKNSFKFHFAVPMLPEFGNVTVGAFPKPNSLGLYGYTYNVKSRHCNSSSFPPPPPGWLALPPDSVYDGEVTIGSEVAQKWNVTFSLPEVPGGSHKAVFYVAKKTVQNAHMILKISFAVPNTPGLYELQFAGTKLSPIDPSVFTQPPECPSPSKKRLENQQGFEQIHSKEFDGILAKESIVEHSAHESQEGMFHIAEECCRKIQEVVAVIILN